MKSERIQYSKAKFLSFCFSILNPPVVAGAVVAAGFWRENPVPSVAAGSAEVAGVAGVPRPKVGAAAGLFWFAPRVLPKRDTFGAAVDVGAPSWKPPPG